VKAAQALAKTILNRLDDDLAVPTTLWVQAHLEIAKFECNQNQNLEGAIGLLLQLRQVLPPIDTSQIRASGFSLPFDIEEFHERPLSERASHLFLEAAGLYTIEEGESYDDREGTGQGEDDDDEGFDFSGKPSQKIRRRGTKTGPALPKEEKQVHCSFITDFEGAEGDEEDQLAELTVGLPQNQKLIVKEPSSNTLEEAKQSG
jgi:hypothetical protein